MKVLGPQLTIALYFKQPDLLDKHTRRRQWRKIILVLKKDDIATHLDRAGRLNMFLAQFTQQNQTSIETAIIEFEHTR